jgi:hypothetical protein
VNQGLAIVIAAVIGAGPGWASFLLSRRALRRQTGEIKDHIDTQLAKGADTSEPH